MTVVFLYAITKEWITSLLVSRKKKKPAELSFYQELEDDYYKEFPEEWKNEKIMTIIGPRWVKGK